MTDVISKKAIKELISEAFDTTLPLDDASEIIAVNSTVDPVASETDPDNEDFVPQSTQELDIAVRSLTSMIGDCDAAEAYKAIKSALETLEKNDGRDMGNNNLEEMLRKHIRTILNEETPAVPQGVAGGGKEEFNFKALADELGMSVSGAKQLVDKSRLQFDYLFKMLHNDWEEFEDFVLNAAGDYIKYLSSSGELSAADIQLLKQHPDTIRELDGFRDWLHDKIRSARLEDSGEVEDDDVDVSTPTPAATASAGTDDPDYAEYQRLHAKFGSPASAAAAAPPANSDGKGYKVYKTKSGLVIRINKMGGKGLYKAGADTKFNPNDRPFVSPAPDGSKIKVKNPTDGHTQEWEFTEGKKHRLREADEIPSPPPADPAADPEYARYLELQKKFGALTGGAKPARKARVAKEPAAPAAPANPDGKGYKVYKTKNGPVVRYKTKLYRGKTDSKFNPNDRPLVAPSPDGAKVRVKNPTDGHTQEWDFEEETAKTTPGV